MTSVELQIERLAARQFVAERGLPNTMVEVERDAALESLVYTMSRHLATETLDSIVIEYHETWWDAFKARWFPKWAIRRWPAVTIRREIDVKAYYPDVSLPDLNHTVRLIDREHRGPFESWGSE